MKMRYIIIIPQQVYYVWTNFIVDSRLEYIIHYLDI